MNRIKKDIMIIYMFQNGFVSFLIGFIAFIFHLQQYYKIDVLTAVRKLMFQDTYVIIYFLLLCILNYLLVEAYKMVYELFSLPMPHTVIFFIVLPILVVVVLNIYVPLVFCYNNVLLVLFMAASTMRQMVVKKK